MAAIRAESRGNAREPGSALRGTHSSAQLVQFMDKIIDMED
jgi:hypothetical protein